MTEPDLTDAPVPTEVVHILRSDFELLQNALNVLTADVGELFELLGIPVEPSVDAGGRSPREVLYTEAFPRIATLINSHGNVLAAGEQITARMKELAARHGNKTFEHGGVKGLMVGKKDPELARVLALGRPMNREERRRFERDGRL